MGKDGDFRNNKGELFVVNVGKEYDLMCAREVQEACQWVLGAGEKDQRYCNTVGMCRRGV